MEHITYIPMDELTTPPEGFIDHIAGRWWIVDQDKGALLYRRCSPQCNRNKAFVEKLRDSNYPECDVVFIEHAFRSIRISDYV